MIYVAEEEEEEEECVVRVRVRSLLNAKYVHT